MTNEMSRPGKCARTGCRRRSVRPRQDGWIYVEFPADLSLKTGWWCPECHAGLQRVLDQQGVDPSGERLR